MPVSLTGVAAWVIGTRSTIKALLAALLEPAALLRDAEADADFTTRLALLEEAKNLPIGAVWQEHCRRQNVAGDSSWIAEVKTYEKIILSKRN